MFEQLEELIQLRQDHDSGAAVRGATFVGIIRGDGYIFPAAGRCDMSRIEAVFFLQDADDGSSTLRTEVPVILERAGVIIRFVVRMTFYHEFDIRLGFEDGGYLAQNSLGGRSYVPFPAIEQEF